MKKITFILFAFIALISCTNSQKEKTIDVENRYSVTIPSFLTETEELNEDASFQYMNGAKELYIAILEDSIADFQEVLDTNGLSETHKNDLNGFADFLFETLKTNLNPPEVSEVKKIEINQMPALLYSFTAKVDGYEVYYQIAYVQGKKNYYQVLTWTLASKEKDFNETMNKMVTSLKEM